MDPLAYIRDRPPIGCDFGNVLTAIARGNVTELERLIEDGEVDLKARIGLFKCQPLLEACRLHQFEAAVVLLEAGASALDSGGGGWTALHYACSTQDNPALVEALISYGAHIDHSDHFGRTPLHFACKNGFCDSLLLLLESGGNPNVVDTDHIWTPLHYASKAGYEECIALLVAFQADVSASDRQGNTALHLASTYQGVDGSIQKLLIESGAHVEAQNRWGELAGNLGKIYQILPKSSKVAGKDRLWSCVCPACGARNECHYYWCNKEILLELQSGSYILNERGLPAPDIYDQLQKRAHGGTTAGDDEASAAEKDCVAPAILAMLGDEQQ